MELLYTLLVLLAVTRLFGEAAVRVGQPALVGNLVGGILVGVLVHAFPQTFPTLSSLGDDTVFQSVTDLGVFFLMLLAGLEMQPRELAKGSAKSFAIAAGGLFLPLGIGVGLGYAFIPPSPQRFAQAMFLGTAVAITAVPVAIKILMDTQQIDTRAGKTIVAAAVIDDVFSLVLLALLTALIRTGELLDVAAVVELIVGVVAFFGVTTALGRYVLPWVGQRTAKLLGSEVEFSLLVLVGLAYAYFAELLHMHFIIGAFVAGLSFGSKTLPKPSFSRVEQQVSGLTKGLLAPIFFASIGLHLELDAVRAVPVFVGVLLVAAIVGKVVGAGGMARLMGFSRRESLTIGTAMTARGAVELIIAGVALRAGLFERPTPVPDVVANMFSSVVIMAIVTTLFAPIVLERLLGGTREKRNSEGRGLSRDENERHPSDAVTR